MTAPNHIVGGYTFTGIFASILGINILSDWSFLALIGFASLLPDIDHTKSIIGKVFYPFSVRINRRFGHRTITHSLIFVFISTAILAAFQAAFFPDFPATLLYFLAVSSHLIFDMMTVQGVPLFYPFMKNACVLPGDPRMRIRTSNIQHEAIAMCTFLISALFLQPLFVNGFWTQYNRAFGTVEHLKSEYNKSEDLLNIEFKVQQGSIVDTLSGDVIRCDGRSFVLLKDGEFVRFPRDGERVFDIYMNHTGRRFEFKEKSFYDYSAKEVNQILRSNLITNMNLFGSEKFIINRSDKLTEKKEYEDEFINEIEIMEIEDDVHKIEFKMNKSIIKLINQIKTYERDFEKRNKFYEDQLSYYNNVQSMIENETDLIKKEILLEQHSDVKIPSAPKYPTEQIDRLEIKIKELEHEDLMRKSELESKNVSTPLRLSGVVQFLEIEESSLSNKLEIK